MFPECDVDWFVGTGKGYFDFIDSNFNAMPFSVVSVLCSSLISSSGCWFDYFLFLSLSVSLNGYLGFL